MIRRRLLPLALACLLVTPSALAEEPPARERSTVEAFLITGDAQRNPGDPPPAKIATVISLYALSVGSFAAGTVFGVRALSLGSDADTLRRNQDPGFCADTLSVPCERYDTLRSSQNAATRSAGLFVGLGTLLFLGGAATAQLWTNDAPELSRIRVQPLVGTRGGGVSIEGRF